MMEIVTATAKDLATLRDIDIKTYFYPVPDDGWAHALVDSSCVVYMVRLGRHHIAYMIVEPSKHNLRVHRLGVIRQYRGHGAAKMLLTKAEELRRATKSKALEVIVPEIHCLPGDPDDISLFLKFQGFKATGIKLDFFTMYGRKYDGFIFERLQ